MTPFIKCVELIRDAIDQVTRRNEITTDIIISMHVLQSSIHVNEMLFFNQLASHDSSLSLFKGPFFIDVNQAGRGSVG